MKKYLDTTAIAVILAIYTVLVIIGFHYLRVHHAVDSNDSLKISDYISAAVAVAATLTGCIAAIFAYRSLRFAQKAEEGKLYLELMKRYSSQEMADALRLLSDFSKAAGDNLQQAVTDWKNRRDEKDANAIKLEHARHRVKYFYRDLMQIHQAGYFTEKLTKKVLNTGGRYVFKSVVLPMDDQVNDLQYEDEYAPFERLFNELNREQKRIQQLIQPPSSRTSGK